MIAVADIKTKVLVVEKVCATSPEVLESFAFNDSFYVVDLEEVCNHHIRKSNEHSMISGVDLKSGSLTISSIKLAGKHNLYTTQLAMIEQLRIARIVSRRVLH